MNAAVLQDNDAVTAILNYHLDDGTKPVNETFGPANIYGRSTGTPDKKPMRIRDARQNASQFNLDTHGFCLARHHTSVKNILDKEELKNTYYPEMERLVCEVSGATRAVLFDHTIRHGDQAVREEKLLREPVMYVHNDYTEASAPRRVRELLPEEADALLAKRFAIIQVWRPLKTISRNPLAIADARSVAFSDLVPSERRYPHRVGETYRILHNPAHEWYQFAAMTPEEAIVFKVYDSMNDGRARFTPHCSFDDPNTPADAPPRESIEARMFAFFA
ncbi:MAG: CmcJ/NvfI family oxidoreductase [Burkholderiales bacterium]